MKASELILHLQKLIADHGDLTVSIEAKAFETDASKITFYDGPGQDEQIGCFWLE